MIVMLGMVAAWTACVAGALRLAWMFLIAIRTGRYPAGPRAVLTRTSRPFFFWWTTFLTGAAASIFAYFAASAAVLLGPWVWTNLSGG